MNQNQDRSAYVFMNEDASMKLALPAFVRDGEREAKAILDNVYQVEELYRLAIDSFRAYTHLALNSADDARYFFRVDHAESFTERVKVNQALASLFTVLRLYKDTVKRIFGDSESIQRLFRMDGFAEIDALRNYMQHVSLLPLCSAQTYGLVRETVCLVQMRHRLEIGSLRTDQLKNQTTRKTLEGMISQGNLDIYEIVMRGLGVFNRIHQIVRNSEYFGEIARSCGRFLGNLDGLSLKKGLCKFILKNEQGEVVDRGDVYLYNTQCQLISDIRNQYPINSPFPIDKIYASNLPDSFVRTCGTGRGIDWKVTGEVHDLERRLLEEYALDGISARVGYTALSKADEFVGMVVRSLL